MTQDSASDQGHVRTDTPVDRTLALTDGVVAIAMTLLVLPLVDLAGQADDPREILRSHGDVFLGFVLSFLVIYMFWSAHDRAFAGLADGTPTLRALNMWWLLGIAFLPFPTAVVGRKATTASASFYIITLFLISAITAAITQLATRAVATAAAGPGAGERSRGLVAQHRRRLVLTWISTAVFAVCALVSLVNADAGLYGLLLLVVVRVVGETAGRWTRWRHPTAPTSRR